MGENAVAPGEGRDNYDGFYKIDTNLLLNNENFISQVCLLPIRTNKNAQIKIGVVIKKKLCKINAG